MSQSAEPAPRLPKFNPGHVVATPAAIVAIEFAYASAVELLHRHVTGDWGDIDNDDKALNEMALKCEARIISAYVLADGTKVWCITEADRSVTTFLLSDEY
jgi:hypothetical protein